MNAEYAVEFQKCVTNTQAVQAEHGAAFVEGSQVYKDAEDDHRECTETTFDACKKRCKDETLGAGYATYAGCRYFSCFHRNTSFSYAIGA